MPLGYEFIDNWFDEESEDVADILDDAVNVVGVEPNRASLLERTCSAVALARVGVRGILCCRSAL